MELKEFVKKVLIDLDQAITEVNKETSRDIRFRDVSGKRNEIEFDIAVTVENKGTKGGKAGIKVFDMIQAGIEDSKEQKNSTVSRISFGLQIGAYTREELKVPKLKVGKIINQAR
ncbi:MAG: hypothetical protein JJE53_02470 [Candidatus Pacebacteria bacterium]|nr:hypothetical protein [Candidatus Paceibacterota bacterium]